jgi:hypothetical protein
MPSPLCTAKKRATLAPTDAADLPMGLANGASQRVGKMVLVRKAVYAKHAWNAWLRVRVCSKGERRSWLGIIHEKVED